MGALSLVRAGRRLRFHTSNWRQRLREGLLGVLLLAAIAQAGANAITPESLTGLNIVEPPTGGAVLGAGSLLLFGGILFLLVAQLQLGASWRIGIEEGASPGLVTRGLYSVCRNPIFLAVFVTMAGLVVLLPNWISVVVTVGTILC